MSVHREVVSLSQLLRRNEKSNSRLGFGAAPPLPLQISRRKVETPKSSRHTSLRKRQIKSVEKPVSSVCQPPSFTQCVRDANHTQRERGQTGGALGLSQEAYEAESEQLSAITSISQSSFSQTQSQNLLGSNQDYQQRDHSWQARQALHLTSRSPVRCNGSEILQELDQNFTKALAEQIRQQKYQQQHLMMQFASPMKKSVEEIKLELVSCRKDHQNEVNAIGELAKTINKVTSTVSELHKQSQNRKEVCAETRTIVVDGTEFVKTALTSLEARVETVECSVKSCSGLVRQVLEETGSKHRQILSAVAASSCICHVEELSTNKKPSRKRRRSSAEIFAGSTKCYTLSPMTRSSTRKSAQSPINCDIAWREDEIQDKGLQLALQHIQSLRDSRRNYLQDW